MSKFALVSTVDTIGDSFPCHCVMLFETEEAAILHAVDLIAEYDDSVSLGKGGWSIGTETWTDPKEFLEAWQDNLGPTEYLHVKPIVPTPGKSSTFGALLAQLGTTNSSLSPPSE